MLLAFDITERETAEQTRREFTANVSHELKTPLQGIIGSAELLENEIAAANAVNRADETVQNAYKNSRDVYKRQGSGYRAPPGTAGKAPPG